MYALLLWHSGFIILGNSVGLKFYTDENAYLRLASDTIADNYAYWDQQCRG